MRLSIRGFFTPEVTSLIGDNITVRIYAGCAQVWVKVQDRERRLD